MRDIAGVVSVNVLSNTLPGKAWTGPRVDFLSSAVQRVVDARLSDTSPARPNFGGVRGNGRSRVLTLMRLRRWLRPMSVPVRSLHSARAKLLPGER